MAHPMTVPLAAAVVIAGTGIGLKLGQGAVSEIDPVHFDSPDRGRFFADLVPGGYDAPASDPTPRNHFQAAESGSLVWDRCDGCESTVEVAAFDDQADYPDLAILAYDEPVVLPLPADAGERAFMPTEVERYAYYPVTSEKAEQLAATTTVHAHFSYADRPAPSRAASPADEPEPIGM